MRNKDLKSIRKCGIMSEKGFLKCLGNQEGEERLIERDG